MNNQKLENKNRIYYMDILKIISCIAVIFLHVSAQNLDVYAPNTYEWQISNFYDSCVRFAVPIFVMVSGALFLDKSKEKINLKKLYTKNILRLLTAYIFYALFYAIFNYYSKYHCFNLGKILNNAVLHTNYHLWFIPMLIGIYVLIPALQKITTNSSKSEIKYLLILFFVFNILKNTIKPFAFPASKHINTVFNSFPVDLLSGYIGYFLLGYYLNTYQIQKRNRLILYMIGVLSLITCIVGNSLYSLSLNKSTQYFYNNFFITTFFTSTAIFTFAKYAISKVKITNFASKIIINLSNASFGIYLIHIAVICSFTLGLNFYTTTYNPIFSIPVISICVFVISLIIINIMKKIPYINKYLT